MRIVEREAPFHVGKYSRVCWATAEIDGERVGVVVKKYTASLPVLSMQREARALGILAGEGVVPLLGADYEAQELYLQRLEGRTLRACIDGGMALGKGVAVLASSARVLARIHQNCDTPAFVHTDVSPNNILVDDGSCATFLDFAGAYPLDAAPISARKLSAFGTHPYVALEKMLGKVELGQKSDVYALGMVGKEVVEAGSAFLFGEPVPLENLGGVLDRCCSQSPLQRPGAATVAQAAEEAQELLAGVELAW